MELFKSKKIDKSTVGIDIGSYAIKAVELSRDKDKLKINNLAYAKLDSKSDTARLLKECAVKINALSKQVNVAVSGPSVVVRFIELPRMTPDELKNAIHFEAEKHIPFNIEDVMIDHQLLNPRIGTDNKMLVLLVAAKKDVVNERINLAKETGLSIGVLDTALFANFNAFLMSAQRKKEELAALVDIGSTATDISIVDKDILCFARSIQLGGNDLTKSLSEALSMEFKAAENIKINPADKAAEASGNMDSILHNIVEEIGLSFSYYENQSGKAIARVFLTGGSSRIKNLDNMMKEELGVETALWNPAEGVEVAASVDKELFESVKDQLGVAIGLALRQI